MLSRFKERYRLWTKWIRWNLNGPIYKLLVLSGFISSPTFNMMPQIDNWEQENI